MQQLRFGGVIVALLLGLILTGCGKGAKQDSPYRGSYRAIYSLPSLGETGVFSFTVEQKGHMFGSFQDNNSGSVYDFNGEIKPAGDFSGSTKAGSLSYPTNGTLSTSRQGQGGDFEQVRNGVKYRGSFTITDTPITEAPTNSFRGSYSGSYSVPGLTQGGVTSFSVNSKGEITGSLTRGNETGSFNGTVQESGSFVGTTRFGNETVTLTGTLNPTTTGSTSGNFQYTAGGTSYPGSFGPTQTAPTGDSPFQGAYRGTYALPENEETGNISFTVDPRGQLTGFFSQSANLPVGTFVGGINNDGTFTGTVTYDPSTGRTPRPITGKLGTSSVGGKLSGDFVMTIDGSNKPGNFEVGIGGSEPDSIYRGSYGSPTITDGLRIISPTGTPLDHPTAFSTDEDSLSYDLATGLTSPTNTVVHLSVTIDKQGNLIGTAGGFPLSVRVTNDGRFYGTYGGYPVRGNLSRQQIKELTNFAVETVKKDIFGEVKDAEGNTTTVKIGEEVVGANIRYTYADKAGFAGDFIITINGKEYYGTIVGIGGNAEGAQPR